MQVPLIKGDKVDSNVDYRDGIPVNMYPILREIRGANGYMNQWYGLTNFAQAFGVDRGGIWVTSEGLDGHYRVNGTRFIKVNPDGSIDDIGEIPGSGQCSITFSFNNIAIVGDRKLYYYNPLDGFRQIIDPQVGQPLDIVWADNLFILTDGVNLYHSNPLNEEEFLPADFGNAQFKPDLTQGLGLNEDNEIIAFGATTTEYFNNAGLENFQFVRIQLKALKLGILGTHCRKEMNGKWYVIGRREETAPGIHIIQSGSNKKISSREIDKILKEYTQAELSTATIDAFSVDNIRFVQINLFNDTLLYNENIGEALGNDNAWSLLKSDIVNDRPFRAKNYVLDAQSDKWICGDIIDGRLGYLDESISTQYDELSEWLLYSPVFSLETLSIDSFEIQTIPGFVIDNDATVFVSITNNGYTYGNEIIELYSENLDYVSRFIVRRLGYIRHLIGFKLRGASRSRMSFCFFYLEAK